MRDKLNKSPNISSLPLGLSMLLALLASGCSVTPPTQEMSDARQSVEAAKQAGAVEHAPGAMDSAEQLLTKAEAGLRTGNFEEAQQDAIAAKEAARQALAISEVKQVEEEPVTTPSTPINEQVVIPQNITYQVYEGESLWSIAAKEEVYGNPLLWPLLLSNNANRITDADLIYPGQSLEVNKSPSHEEIDSAKAHALSRGAWHIGQIESSDTDYLSR